MKPLKILLLFFALFLTGTNLILAQSQTTQLTDEQKEELAENMEKYFEALNLSEEQKTEFEAITKKYAVQLKEVRDGGGSRMQKYRKVKSIRKARNSEMEELLSKDQYEIYLEKQEEMQKKMKERRNQN